MQQKIPKIIHQIWLGNKKKPENLMKTWIQKNPTWEYKFWNENNIPILTNKKLFDKTEFYHCKADILRYELLYNYGGFFIDADSECILSLQDFLLDNDSFACYESEKFRPELVANGYLASIQNNELMLQMINEISKINDVRIPWKQTGPLLLTNTIKKNNYTKIKIYPSHFFIPKHFESKQEYIGEGPVFAKQYWGSTKGYDKLS